MTRKELLQSYFNGYDGLASQVKDLSKEVLYYKPSEDKWSIAEIIMHLSDAECNSNLRFRKAIAESGSRVELYDQDLWAKLLKYQECDLAVSLALIKILRMNNYFLFLILDENVWDNFIIHPERGKLTLDNLLKIYTEHLEIHIKQIKRNTELFKTRQSN